MPWSGYCRQGSGARVMEGIDQGMQRQFGALQVPGLESISDGGESLLAVGAEKWIRTVEWTLLAQIDHRPGKPAEHRPDRRTAVLAAVAACRRYGGESMSVAAEAASSAKSRSWT